MENATVFKVCDCPMECNTISYSFSIISTPFDPKKMCPGSITVDDFLMKPFYQNKSPPQFVRKLEQFRNNISSGIKDICMRNIQYRAEIIFTLATNTLPVTIMSKRLSFFDKLSAFGIK